MKLVGGGLLKGTAKPFSRVHRHGETVIGLNYHFLEGAKKGELESFLSFEETPEELYSNAANFGWDLKGWKKKEYIKSFTHYRFLGPKQTHGLR
jgi:circadian clock protein KaiC